MTFLLVILVTLVSEDLACIGAGLLVAEGSIRFWPAVLACLVGLLIGDVFLWVVGRYIGRPALGLPVLRWLVRAQSLDRAEQWFRRRGPLVLFGCRFVPGTRLPLYFAAGLLRCGLGTFTFWLLLAGAVWTPVLVGFSVLAGGPALDHFRRYQTYSLLTLLVTVGALWLAWKLVIPLLSRPGRRLLVARWRRLSRREF